MDSVTQVMLGAAVGQAVLGTKAGRKAAIWGAVCGTLPDLDVFIPFGGAVEDFTFHRSFSHAFFVHALITPLIVWLILRIHPDTRPFRRQWFWLVLLALTTHAMLDSFTVYGTQIFWPFSEYPVGLSSIFIIDPFYTIPLAAGVLTALWIGTGTKPDLNTQTDITHRNISSNHWGQKANTLGLVISSLYLCWTLVAKWHIDHTIEAALKAQNIPASHFETTPGPFNSLLWRVVVMADDHYYEGFTSVLDNPPRVNLNAYPTHPELLTSVANEWGVRRLQWFTKGFNSVKAEGNTVILSDLRMGIEGSYVFTFQVGTITPDGIVPGSYKQVENQPDMGQIHLVWDRIFDPSVSLTPQARILSDSSGDICLESC